MLKDKYKVYSLSDPTDNIIKYIGITKQYLCKRLENHIYISKNHTKKDQKDIWITQLLNNQIKPKIQLLELIDNKEDAYKAEEKYINLYKVNLLNKQKNIFYTNKSKKNYGKEYFKKNKEKIMLYQKEYNIINKEKRKNYDKEYNSKRDKDSVNDRTKEWQSKNKERFLLYQKEYREKKRK